MTKNTNLFLIIALIFSLFLSSSTGVPAPTLEKRQLWPQLVARASFNLNPPCSLFGEFDFTQLAFQFTRILGQINEGMNNPNPSAYTFGIFTTQNDGTLVKPLTPTFSVNAPPGGTSAIQLDIPDIALQPGLPLASTPAQNAKDVHNLWLRISMGSTILCSAQILLV
ncbi:3897_t:CDS:1 [Ambispora leptoticha]|uniref:3897_t:CDS:1 n=1 Tax=Ambispora leptoticha TaxID=144679 RepID=A0A9N9I1I5_9GLOM|nr:3897_t:CDS:1 [Ambispora leptoticha]